MGCTLNCDPNWLSVFSPRIASTATRALNFGLYCFLVVVIDLSAVNDSRRNLSLLPGLNSGDHYRSPWATEATLEKTWPESRLLALLSLVALVLCGLFLLLFLERLYGWFA